MARTRRASPKIGKKQRGAYYTPAPIARHILHFTVSPLLQQTPRPRVLDPACGDGIFLLEAARLLAEASGVDVHATDSASVDRRAELVRECLYGVDIDQQAVTEARQRMSRWILGSSSTSTQCEVVDLAKDPRRAGSLARSTTARSATEHNITWGNTLLPANDPQTISLPSPAPPVELPTFHAVVGNPPYINIRLASQTLDPALRAYYAARYTTARGAYDQYVLFLERACELLQADGRYGWILPNKLAGAGYAQACRQLLMQQTTLDRWEDLSAVRVFAEAGVYPHIIVGCNRPPEVSHCISISRWPDGELVPSPVKSTTIAATSLNKHGWTLGTTLEVESRVDTIALGELGTLHSGATGFQAQQLAAELFEADELPHDQHAFRFITSGNIDRFAIDDQNVRFMKRRFTAASLPHDSQVLTENKRRLYAAEKIVVAGMTKRLEVAYDRVGRALGVQVYAAIRFECDPYYLLGVLNSRLMSHLFRNRFAAKRLAGGYLSINKRQLVELPIAMPADQLLPQQIAALARQLEQLQQASQQTSTTHVTRLESKLDRSVYELYRLTDGEIADIDRAFAKAA